MSDRIPLLPGLQAALHAAQHPRRSCAKEPLPDKGLAHYQVHRVGSGWLARLLKQSQMRLGAAHNLADQRACFERAAPSGHTPSLHSALPPSTHLPRGALLVQDIAGRPARLPHDLPAMVVALASLRALPVPQAPRRAMASQLQALAERCDPVARPPRHRIAFDGHPGNFIVRDDGSAALVDLEKGRYSYPGLDLAQATLYASSTWDVATHAVLSLGEVLCVHRVWAQSIGPAANAALPWAVPLRRAMWRWSVTWYAKWRVLAPQPSRHSAGGEDWSAERSDSALVHQVRDRVDHHLSGSVVERVLQDLDALEKALSA